MRIYYTLKTLDPIIVSQTTATSQNHQCLDYIPGSAILGALAAQHYHTLDPEQSWQAFHNGACRFSPCYPLSQGEMTLPVPASWHFPKGEDFVDKNTGKLNTPVLSNHTHTHFSRETGIQYKQCREGYVNACTALGQAKQGLATKTAIDSETGKAKESQLFSYSYIERQQLFAGWFESDNAELLDKFKQSMQNTLRIGRSRNTEFGRVELTLQPLESTPPPENFKQKLVLWCLSDCELINEYGMPTLNPMARDLHPALSGTLNRQQTFVRLDRVSRFNQKRQGLDSEQIILGKGSVLVFDLDNAASSNVLQKIQSEGIGINRQQGLGWVSINPAWAKHSTVAQAGLFHAIPVKHSQNTETEISTSLLTQWVNERISEQMVSMANQEHVNHLLKKICNGYKNARRYNNIINRNEAGPSATQWRRIQNEIRTNNEQWSIAVFSGNNPICQSSNDELGWGIQWYENSLNNFSDYIKTHLAKQPVSVMRLLLEQLCRYDLSTFTGLKKIAEELKIDMGVQ